MPRYRNTYRLAYDQEEGMEELKEMLDDGDVDFGDLIAAAVEYAPEGKQDQALAAMREMAHDSRGPRAWARDRLERRRLSKDMGPAMEPGGAPQIEHFSERSDNADAQGMR